MTVTSKIRLQNIFDLTDAIGKKNESQALLCLARLLESGQNEVGMTAMIHRHIRLLRQTMIGKNGDCTARSLPFCRCPLFSFKRISFPNPILE